MENQQMKGKQWNILQTTSCLLNKKWKKDGKMSISILKLPQISYYKLKKSNFWNEKFNQNKEEYIMLFNIFKIYRCTIFNQTIFFAKSLL